MLTLKFDNSLNYQIISRQMARCKFSCFYSINFISMIPVYVNNNLVLVPQTASVLEACEAVGVTVPRFCYHSQLPIAGNCRMCLARRNRQNHKHHALPVTKYRFYRYSIS